MEWRSLAASYWCRNVSKNAFREVADILIRNKNEFVQLSKGHFLPSSAHWKQCGAAIFGTSQFTNLLNSPVESPCLCNFSSLRTSVGTYLVSEAHLLQELHCFQVLGKITIGNCSKRHFSTNPWSFCYQVQLSSLICCVAWVHSFMVHLLCEFPDC